jgi:cytoskeletal protein RodZ
LLSAGGQDNNAGMPTVAEQLRGAREGQGLTIHQVAELTKIKSEHIRCLESGDYDTFSAPVYIRGFVRTYASLLKLEVPVIIAALEEELSKIEKFREPPRLTESPHSLLDFVTLQLSKVNWRVVWPMLVIAAILALSIMGLRAWRRHQTKDPLADLGPGIYQAPASQTAPTLPLPSSTNLSSRP